MTAPLATHTSSPTIVLVALGSDTLQAAYIQWASQQLLQLLTDLHFSRTLWTADIHGSGRYYMNRLAVGATTLSANQLQQALKAIEQASQRSPGRVTIDLDLMQYGTQRYHLRDWPRAYIQQLLPEVQHELPETQHNNNSL